MPAFEYAIVRLVPRVEREEFINAGVIVFCEARDYLASEVELDESVLLAVQPGADVASLREHLQAIPRLCAGEAEAGPIAALPLRERWRWLTAPRSTALQTSAAHAGVCEEPERMLRHIFESMVKRG